MNVLQLVAPLLLMTVTEMSERFQYYKNYRLEKLCPPDGRKVRMRMEDTVSAFQLNSSLVPGSLFNCHLELVLDSSDSGFFVYFDLMWMADETGGECQDDYVQFGRDILFITSHRSNKYCGVIEGTVQTPPPNASIEDTQSITPLDKRIYSESSDQEMDVWVKMTVPSTGTRPKTLSLIVTPFKKNCNSLDRRYKRCGSSAHCVRAELFCDGAVNCAVPTRLPQDENGCKITTAPPMADTTIWQHPSLPHFIGSIFSLVFMAVVLFYIVKNCWPRGSIPKDRTSSELDRRYHHDLIDMDGLIVPVGRPPPRVPRCAPPPPAPPSYNDSIDLPDENSAQEFTPQYSYSNR